MLFTINNRSLIEEQEMEESAPLRGVQESGAKPNLNVTSSAAGERKPSLRVTSSTGGDRKPSLRVTSSNQDAEKAEQASKETGAIPKKQPSVKH